MFIQKVDLNQRKNREKITHVAKQRSKLRNLNESLIHNASIMKGQVGGISGKKKRILSTQSDSLLLKPLQNDNRGLREVAFYEIVASIKAFERHVGDLNVTDLSGKLGIFDNILFHIYKSCYKKWYSELKQLCDLSDYIVEYHGILCCDDSQHSKIVSYPTETQSYMILSDELSNYDKPCVIDLKIGTATYEPDAKQSKKEKQRKKYPQQKEFGFRIVGYQVYDPNHQKANSSGFCQMSKIEGRSLASRDSIKKTLQRFFNIEDSSCINERKKVIESSIGNLMTLKNWFQRNKSFAFYASSLLLIYEGSEVKLDTKCPILKMIDFAHTTKHNSLDEGYLHGLDEIISMFKEILQSS